MIAEHFRPVILSTRAPLPTGCGGHITIVFFDPINSEANCHRRLSRPALPQITADCHSPNATPPRFFAWAETVVSSPASALGYSTKSHTLKSPLNGG